ncbi:EF-P beta-lysylation protein EpmB [Halopseudomonas salegens]|uniref:L-lysine 2,3-aminomutase n=1 Tax=Halopseudomonas salegens TaxID=1434072 RepID=A0A1H2G0H6_9GAMM|nr:EF-P beta-lysylation protein EpmB [Halopseudomonas salegens]SDU13075.1 L-lysine 2,3-aminomutase [Halopseudomonas salegens]
MIHGYSAAVEPARWQNILADSVTDPRELLTRLQLGLDLLPAAVAADKSFRLRVPTPFIDLMQPGNPHDPLLRQILPLGDELLEHPGFVSDPLGEQHSNPQPGIVHKYHGRLLLIVSGGCAVNCRYCFRRHFPYADNNLSTTEWHQALDYIRQDDSIKEVILSGGDPLIATDKRLAWLTTEIAGIPHVRRLRVHTRLPLVLPQRITESLITALTATRLPLTVVLHCNHANELGTAQRNAIQQLRQAGVMLLNQAVLLRGVNDNLTDLCDLSENLGDTGVLPYYLHMLDHVRGAQHFLVDEATATRLMAQLLIKLPGFMVPRLVREVAGQPAKVPIPVDLVYA